LHVLLHCARRSGLRSSRRRLIGDDVRYGDEDERDQEHGANLHGRISFSISSGAISSDGGAASCGSCSESPPAIGASSIDSTMIGGGASAVTALGIRDSGFGIRGSRFSVLGCRPGPFGPGGSWFSVPGRTPRPPGRGTGSTLARCAPGPEGPGLLSLACCRAGPCESAERDTSTATIAIAAAAASGARIHAARQLR